MKVRISDIAILNRKNINKSNKFEEIKYLDTGSIFEGKVSEYKKLKVGEDSIPSRAKRLVTDNTIVYSSVRPRLCHYGILNKPTKNTVVSTGFITIDAILNKVNPYYLYYKLIQNEVTEYLAAIADTAVSAYPSITPNDLANLEIDIIDDINDQEKIAMLFKYIEYKINNNNKINSELESMAKTIYDYWFLQFEFPNEEGKPYKSSGGKMVWNEKLGRKIPEGWEVGKLGENCRCVLGGTPSRAKKEYWGGNINWINSGMINNFRISSCSERITKLGLENSSTYLMPKNTVVLAITGATLGQVSILNIESCANQSVVGILENSQMPTEYIYPFILSTIKNLLNNKTGAAQPHINKNDIMSFEIISPDKKIMKNYIKNIKGVYELIMKNEKENQLLSSYRDFLIPLLMNGQVGFKENISAKEIEVSREEVVTLVNR